MDLRPLLLAPLVLLSVAGCSEARDTAGQVQDCAGLARDVVSSGLSGVPTQAEAEAAKQRLDDRVAGIGDQTLKDAAGALSDRLGEVAEAVRGTDRALIEEKVAAAREAAGRTASACNVDVSQFLG